MTKTLSTLGAALIAVALLATGIRAAEPNPPKGENQAGNKNAQETSKPQSNIPQPAGQANDPVPPASQPAPAAQPQPFKDSTPSAPAPPKADQPDRSPDPRPNAAAKPQGAQPAAPGLNKDDDTDANQLAADRNQRREGREDRRDANRADRRDREPANVEGRRDPSGAIRRQTNRPLSDDRDDRRAARDRGGRDRDYAAHFSNLGLNLTVATNGASPLVISSIGPRGYFVDAGFRPGDQIISANGQRFTSQAALYTWLGTVPIGQRVAIVIVRNNREETIYWTPSPEFMQAYAKVNMPNTHSSFLGIYLDEQVDDAAVVADVERDSPADQAGVQPDDVIVAFNGERVSNRDDFHRAVSGTGENTPIDLHVSRTLALHIGPNQPVTQTGAIVPATPTPPTVTPVPADLPPVRVQRAPPRGGLFRRGR